MARNRFNSGTAPEQELNKVKINKQSLRTASGLLSYLKPYRWKFILGLIFLFLSSLTGLVLPALLGAMIDAAKGEPKNWMIPSTINAIGIMAFVILFFQSFVSFFRIRLFVEVAEKSIADIRRDTYFRLITLPMNFFANRRVGELNSRLSSDLSQIQDTLTTTLAEMIRQVILLTGGIGLLVFVSPKLTLFNISILPILIIAAVFLGRKIRKISKQAQDKLAESNTVVEETLQGISNVKAFTNEAYEAGRYDKTLREVVKIALKGATLRGGFASFIIFCLFGAIVGVIWYGSILVLRGDLTIGDLTMYILYSMFVGAAMGTFPELYANVQKALGSSERVIEILNEQNEPVNIIASENATRRFIKGDLEFNKVEFAYPSRKEITVLQGLSFKATAGEKVAIVGTSGAGKSTIASLILRFYDPQGGQVLFDGEPADHYALTDIRNQVAIVPQDVLLFGGSIRENIAYGKLDATDDEIKAAAEKANADRFIKALPEGYNTMVGERGVKLSGGQRQRIAIARALLKDPAILILDEATSSLDSESERLVQEALEVLMKNRTSIIIAHRLSTIREADRIIVLEKGNIIESGTHDELMKNEEGLYRYLSQLQFEV
ncbi:ABC transporter fused permease/ATP-binding protein [Arcticibacter tournemirensis]|uniref:ATP-binding cassette domain-containing protein n=1 Tax=Arcticibacter tournemirensis TaxID=699437 RepID=A0A4Q0MFG1_9SPHI|nr:ABC transporter transmembrane domain-containing protein [Arcticibacter tournemirensis]KAA8482809.1 ATP-binding cassette domain-containing protein [Arcticibacter tournemirensis]RXF72230.1 ATP-binding cassette domain-containing protein [Arcticibacter tournemirensis]TQM51110.1 ABC transporter fused permease/ATP-binding protein [Arcticibacter tournemirensis]